MSTPSRVQLLALVPLLFVRTIASRREQSVPSGVNSSVVVVTVMVEAAYAGIAGNAASTIAVITMAVKSFCETEEKILVCILFPFLRVKWGSGQAVQAFQMARY